MVIYEVNLDVDDAIANEYAAWLREHIRDMLEIDGFVAAAWYTRDGDDAEGRRAWTIHYQLEDRAVLRTYFDEHAERMRGEGVARFEGRFEAARRVLEQREVFTGVITEE